jgi:hypothetical protein
VGLISGAIKLSANADVLNITGGAIAGNIVGQGSSNTINFALGAGTFTYANSFTGINQANFNSGTVVLEGADTVSNVAINSGTVVVGNNQAFGTAPVAMAAGTTLTFVGGNNFTLANNFTLSGDPNFTPPSGTWNAMPVQLRARVAWAHDWVSDPALDAVFQALPGSSFIVNGAPVPHDSALTSVGAELHLRRNGR